jgi:hypothetical protein
MNVAYAKGVALPKTSFGFDRFHVLIMAVEAMDGVRQTEVRD